MKEARHGVEQRGGVEWVGHPNDGQSTESGPGEPQQPKVNVDQRVNHCEYGRGTVVLFHGDLLQVLWDRPLLEGTSSRLMSHDASFVRQLTPLIVDADGREFSAS
ncbi:hypothetical protein Kfla_2669 [Kribbella flavida DSM 17836]|uniref:Uncharacterized protein n=1 Tax=Kribbella flavida (strain DSM 17836 / JCM 10339 / NBRC 14399) TaxID=479435 RepID=D2PXU3_KRIFD|nr:hypothetical protein [Kribbella flavida]ADB31735.1 hypothetical protein Kfla_2669 [Kribbella flavida DSM 17836]